MSEDSVDNPLPVMNSGDEVHGSDSSVPLVHQRAVLVQFKEKYILTNMGSVSPTRFLCSAALLQVVGAGGVHSLRCSKKKEKRMGSNARPMSFTPLFLACIFCNCIHEYRPFQLFPYLSETE